MTKSVTNSAASRAAGQTRRGMLRSLGAAGIGAAAVAPLGRRVMAQAKAPVKIAFWTFDNPQQRPWVHKRVKLFMEQNPNVTVDFQWFPFGDLGKKLSVGFATGTAPEGSSARTGSCRHGWTRACWRRSTSSGWVMPPDGIHRRLRAGLRRRRRPRTARSTAIRCGSTATAIYLNTKQFKEVGLDARQGLAAELGAARRGGEAADHQGRRQVRPPGLQVRDACGRSGP